MPTLHNVTENTKKILKFGGIFILIIVILFLLFRGGVFLKEYFFPTPVDPPTVAFGKLPAISFPIGLPSENLTFEVDTITGKLPTFVNEDGSVRDRMNIYEIYNPEFSLLDLQNTKNTVATIGFRGQEISLGENIYLWNSVQGGLERTIEMNIINKNFNYASAFRSFDRILSGENMPDQKSAVTSAERFLSSMDLFPEDIDPEKTRTELLFIQGNELVPAENLREANIIRVNFYQNDIDTFPIFYPNPPYSLIDFFIGSGERFDPDIVQATFYHQLITDESSTYPLKSVASAFEELQNGQGYIGANFVEGDTIKIKDVLLGYYVSDLYQEYLIPIYIFKGLNDEFYAYVIAIPDEWFINDETAEITSQQDLVPIEE